MAMRAAITRADRKPDAPAASAVKGGIAVTIAVLLSGAIVGNNPELAPWREVMIVGAAGILGGAGNIARTGLAAGASGWRWAAGQLFGWLG